MAAPQYGPFKFKQATADTQITAKSAVLASLTVANGGGAAVTVTVYDDAGLVSSLPVETLVVNAGATAAVYPQALCDNGIAIKSSSWTTVTASVRWTPR